MRHVRFELSPPAARPTTVLFDAMGTVLRLENPVARLRAALATRGIERSDDEAAQALALEVAVYRARHLEGRDAASIEALRRTCADELRHALGASSLDHEAGFAVLMETLAFRPIDGAVAALRRLRGAGISTAVVSNWDASLHDTLAVIGLRDHVDAVVTSADVGTGKPDPAALVRALELLGVGPGRAVMVGDDPVDAEAAHALGIPCALVAPGEGITGVVDELLALAA